MAAARPQLSVFIAASLDGFIARADGSIDWLDAVQRDGEDYGFAAFYAGVDALVIGRGTYDTALGFPSWPYAGKRVVVLTHRGGEPRHGEELVAATPLEIAARLGAAGVARAYVDGGNVIRQFLAAGLVDDLTVSVIPILLGAGRPLFGGGGEHALALADSRAYPSGLVQLRYQLTR